MLYVSFYIIHITFGKCQHDIDVHVIKFSLGPDGNREHLYTTDTWSYGVGPDVNK